MQLAIEYLVRKGIVKKWLRLPCSLFVSHELQKKVITISDSKTQCYNVKHWHTHCPSHQAVPSFVEFKVPKSELFSHQAVIVPNHRLMKYHISPVPFERNLPNKPMLNEMYTFFYDQYLDSYKHKEEKINWLWKEFVNSYMPKLNEVDVYIQSYKSSEEIAAEQRNLTATVHPEIWLCWKKWYKNMLCLNSPGELFFMEEYRQGDSCKKASQPSLSSLLLP